MKKYILLSIVAVATMYNRSADLQDLPTDPQLTILLYSIEGKTFDEYIKNFQEKMLVNTYWQQLLNDPHAVTTILTDISKKWNTSKSAIAFALHTPASERWLKDNHISHEQIFAEAITDDHLSSDFLSSKYFMQLGKELASELSKKILDELSSGKINSKSQEYQALLRRLGILYAFSYKTLQIKLRQAPQYFSEAKVSLVDIFSRLSSDSPFKEHVAYAIFILASKGL